MTIKVATGTMRAKSVLPMNPSLHAIEQDIARERVDLDAWLAESYAGIESQRYNGERDAGYEGWGRVESLVGRVFDLALTQQLNPSCVESILFFISRSDELGHIIAWLTPGPFSGCGNLSYPDFLFLSERAVARPDDFCDYQLVCCFFKCESLVNREIELLHQFFRKRDSYTRRMVLHVFEHFALPQVVDLATNLWQTDDCEFAKLSCLHALKAMPDAKELFEAYLQEYQNTFDIDAENYRQSHMRKLTSGNS